MVSGLNDLNRAKRLNGSNDWNCPLHGCVMKMLPWSGQRRGGSLLKAKAILHHHPRIPVKPEHMNARNILDAFDRNVGKAKNYDLQSGRSSTRNEHRETRLAHTTNGSTDAFFQAPFSWVSIHRLRASSSAGATLSPSCSS